MRVSDTLAFAVGYWRIERVLADHRSGTEGRFTGQAVLGEPDLPGARAAAGHGAGAAAEARAANRDGAALRYLETGELRFGPHTGPGHPRPPLPGPAGWHGGRAVRGRPPLLPA